MKIVVGARRSALARWQARYAAREIQRALPEVDISFAQIGSAGDRDRASSFQEIGGIGLFTKDSEEALLRGDVDLVVHSLKDLPTRLTDGLVLPAIFKREDPRDALCGKTLSELYDGIRIGTSSIRRRAQILNLFPGVDIQQIRGNVPTRLKKIKQKQGVDATFLAVAGLNRLGLRDAIDEILDPELFPYAVGQGALAVESRSGDEKLCALISLLDHEPTRMAVTAERTLLHALNAGCSLPVGVNTTIIEANMNLKAQVTSVDGSVVLKAEVTGPIKNFEALGDRLAKKLIAQGADELLSDIQKSILGSRGEV